jgi:O-antigen/teichoic acid export membrane protein
MFDTIEVATPADSKSTIGVGAKRWTPRLFSAVTNGALAILGQALFAGSHFLLNVLLARWLLPEQYGAFALVYSGFLLVLMVYSACVYEPLIVFGSNRYAGRFQEYFGLLARGNVLRLTALGGFMYVLSLSFTRSLPSEVARDFAALSLAAPFILLTSLGRGGFYARMKPGEAALGGAVYFLTLLAAVVALRLDGRVSGSSAFLGMGLAGLTTTVYFFCRSGFEWRRGTSTLGMKQVWGDHWSYGRWALASALVSWFPQNIYYSLLPAKTGLQGAAALRALTNLINPILHTLIALSAVLIPALVRDHQEGGIIKLKSTMRTLMVLLIPSSVVYFFALWLGRSLLFQLLYAGRYQEYRTWPLILIGLVPITATATMIVGSALRALEKPQWIFWSYAASTVSVIVVGLPLTLHSGVLGATWSLFISGLVAGVTMTWFFRRATSEEAENLRPELP